MIAFVPIILGVAFLLVGWQAIIAAISDE